MLFYLCYLILLFTLSHNIPHLIIVAGWIAMMGAIALILLADINNIEDLMEQVEWTTLVFFTGLFILMKVRSPSFDMFIILSMRDANITVNYLFSISGSG